LDEFLAEWGVDLTVQEENKVKTSSLLVSLLARELLFQANMLALKKEYMLVIASGLMMVTALYLYSYTLVLVSGKM
jgi:hypothetical protein